MSGYDVTYATDIDVHANGSLLLNYRGILAVGHPEYFSKQMYDGFSNALAAGVNLGFFAADPLDGQVRVESSVSGVPHRVEVWYRDPSLAPATAPTLRTAEGAT